MTFDCVFVNGDSYSAPGGLITKVYGHWLADYFNVPLVNLSVEGSNNDRILRSSIEWLSDNQYKNPLVIVGWSFLRRQEVCYYGNNQEIVKYIPDRESTNSRMITLDFLLNSNEATAGHKALIVDGDTLDKPLLDFYTNLYLFSNLLESRNIKYLFYSAADNTDAEVSCYPAISGLNIVKEVVANPNIFQLHTHCTKNWGQLNDPQCGSTGHLSLQGHKNYAWYLLSLIQL